jgi:deazaflavin-dependent oxidoreductase (nitroreductase family)
MKQRVVTWMQRHLANPVARRVARYMPGQAIIETVGRRSGLPRQTPVGGQLEGSTFWVVTEFGRASNYVRNMEENPKVRVQLKGKWHTGTAHLLPDDDVKARLRRLPRLNSLSVRMVGTDLMTVRIDLDGL